jgi:hypothetical protein
MTSCGFEVGDFGLMILGWCLWAGVGGWGLMTLNNGLERVRSVQRHTPLLIVITTPVDCTE